MITNPIGRAAAGVALLAAHLLAVHLLFPLDPGLNAGTFMWMVYGLASVLLAADWIRAKPKAGSAARKPASRKAESAIAKDVVDAPPGLELLVERAGDHRQAVQAAWRSMTAHRALAAEMRDADVELLDERHLPELLRRYGEAMLHLDGEDASRATESTVGAMRAAGARADETLRMHRARMLATVEEQARFIDRDVPNAALTTI